MLWHKKPRLWVQLRKELRARKQERKMFESLGWEVTNKPQVAKQIDDLTARIRELEAQLGIAHPVSRRKNLARVIKLDDHRKRKSG